MRAPVDTPWTQIDETGKRDLHDPIGFGFGRECKRDHRRRCARIAIRKVQRHERQHRAPAFDDGVDLVAPQRPDGDAHAAVAGGGECAADLLDVIADLDHLNRRRTSADLVRGKESLPHRLRSRGKNPLLVGQNQCNRGAAIG